jgi:hypothetical protein
VSVCVCVCMCALVTAAESAVSLWSRVHRRGKRCAQVNSKGIAAVI